MDFQINSKNKTTLYIYMGLKHNITGIILINKDTVQVEEFVHNQIVSQVVQNT